MAGLFWDDSLTPLEGPPGEGGTGLPNWQCDEARVAVLLLCDA